MVVIGRITKPFTIRSQQMISSEKIGTTKDNNENYAFMEIDSDSSWSDSVLY
jgi:hypothetical protein